MNKMSKGEQKVYSLLKSSTLIFKREVSFEGLTGARNTPLRFDFVIYDQRGRAICCIEVDGRQHFVYTPHFHASKVDFRRQIEFDIRKNKYCLHNNIPLIRIPYWAIETLTLNDIFYNPKYRVINPNHNLMLEVQ